MVVWGSERSVLHVLTSRNLNYPSLFNPNTSQTQKCFYIGISRTPKYTHTDIQISIRGWFKLIRSALLMSLIEAPLSKKKKAKKEKKRRKRKGIHNMSQTKKIMHLFLTSHFCMYGFENIKEGPYALICQRQIGISETQSFINENISTPRQSLKFIHIITLLNIKKSHFCRLAICATCQCCPR